MIVVINEFLVMWGCRCAHERISNAGRGKNMNRGALLISKIATIAEPKSIKKESRLFPLRKKKQRKVKGERNNTAIDYASSSVTKSFNNSERLTFILLLV